MEHLLTLSFRANTYMNKQAFHFGPWSSSSFNFQILLDKKNYYYNFTKYLPLSFLCVQRRNRKHLFMLRCLATNDLVALLGMLVQMYITIYTADTVTSSRSFCSLRIAWRLFGLFSGCVGIVMAVERWLALTRPFFYQKVISNIVDAKTREGIRENEIMKIYIYIFKDVIGHFW